MDRAHQVQLLGTSPVDLKAWEVKRHHLPHAHLAYSSGTDRIIVTDIIISKKVKAVTSSQQLLVHSRSQTQPGTLLPGPGLELGLTAIYLFQS